MAINDISLSASMRANLLSLKDTTALLSRTQERLSTGKKVNSAMDNPSSYFTAKALNNRANDLNSLLDNMGQAVQTLNTADQGITSLTGLVEQARSIVGQAEITPVTATKISFTSASSPAVAYTDATATAVSDKLSVTVSDITTDPATDVEVSFTATATEDTLDKLITAFNASENAQKYNVKASVVDGDIVFSCSSGLAVKDGGTTIAANAPTSPEAVKASVNAGGLMASVEQYNDLLVQITQLVNDTSYKGINLINGDDLTVNFNENRTSFLLIEGVHLDAESLGLTPLEDAYTLDDKAKLNELFNTVDAAISTLRDAASTFGQNLSVVETRQDFTESIINILTSGSDALVLADMNEEAANMLALQTRQALGTNALSMASQADQSVLSLFQ